MKGPEQTTVRWVREHGELLLVLAGGLALIIASQFLPDAWHIRRRIVEGVGEALVIAFIVGLVVETKARERLLREVTSQTWEHLIAPNLPVEIRDFIKGGLIDTKLVTTKWEISYRFEVLPENRLRVYITTKRVVENRGVIEQKDKEFERTVFMGQEPEFISYTVEGATSFSWPTDRDAALVETEDDMRIIRPRKITFAPYGQPGSVYAFMVQHSQVMNMTDTDINVFGMPSVGMSVYYEGGLPPDVVFIVNKMEHQTGPCWRTDKVVWAGQFCRVRWIKRPAPPSSQSQ
jgi:hypothetical protein